jgi:CRISPR/Cas system CMR subunit Cmr4 (Cas7 group RAMP superfamily)
LEEAEEKKKEKRYREAEMRHQKKEEAKKAKSESSVPATDAEIVEFKVRRRADFFFFFLCYGIKRNLFSSF